MRGTKQGTSQQWKPWHDGWSVWEDWFITANFFIGLISGIFAGLVTVGVIGWLRSPRLVLEVGGVADGTYPHGTFKRAGIVDFRFHDLRHHAASWMRRRGTDIQTVGAILGHKDLRMTLRYAHLFQEELQEAVNRLVGLTGETSGYTTATIPAEVGGGHS